MKISRTAAFTALNARHENERNATKKFMVKTLTKSGQVSKSKPTSANWQFDAFVTEAEAETRKAALEQMNPNYKFVIVAL